MIVVVNKEEREVQEDITLKQLVNELDVENNVMACVVNDNVVKKQNYNDVVLKDGDDIDLLSFVAGG